jgi:hypothetical protein
VSEDSVAADVSQPGGSAAPVPLVAPMPRERDYFSKRFIAVYAGLGLILVASVGSLLAFGLRPGFHSTSWSSWKPHHGSVATMTKEIADHIAPEYRLQSGAQVAAVVPSSPTVTAGTSNIAIAAVALHKATGNTDVQTVSPGSTAMYTLCGLGNHCSIATGKPSLTRGRLVHREGLEAALYTFKYVHPIQSVIVFMPPAKGANATTVLYYQKSDLSYPLSHPLRDTLRLAVPPRSNQADDPERVTIDTLTYPHLYTSALTQLQPGGALLILTPVLTS